METSPQKFYDDLTNIYDLMFADWRSEVVRQGGLLKGIFAKYAPNTSKVLDATCGIGTQAIALALNGFSVKASDISDKAVVRAMKEARSFDVRIETKAADLLELYKSWPGDFDAVVSFDNSLSHFQKDEDLLTAVSQMKKQLRAGGVFMASIRDYDALISDGNKTTAGVETAKAKTLLQQLPGEYEPSEKPNATLPRVFKDGDSRRIVFQIWDWAADGSSYAINQFFLLPEGNAWKTIHHTTRFRALKRETLTQILKKAGFSEVTWLMPEESGFYQPLVIAR